MFVQLFPIHRFTMHCKLEESSGWGEKWQTQHSTRDCWERSSWKRTTWGAGHLLPSLSLAQTAICKFHWVTSPRGRVPPPRHLPLIGWFFTSVTSGRLDTCVGQRAPEALVCVLALCPGDFPGKNTWVGCHALLQGIFLTQGSNPGLPPSR